MGRSLKELFLSEHVHLNVIQYFYEIQQILNSRTVTIEALIDNYVQYYVQMS